jgi:2-iminobutanoate/2-iminopropanoate deaminase
VANCVLVLAAGGASIDDVVAVGILLTDSKGVAALNVARSGLFGVERPVRYVARLRVTIPGILVSVQMTAHVTSGR